MKLNELNFDFNKLVGVDINGHIKYMSGYDAYIKYGDNKVKLSYNVRNTKVFKIAIYNIHIQYYDGFEKWHFNIEKIISINGNLFMIRDFEIEYLPIGNACSIEVKEK